MASIIHQGALAGGRLKSVVSIGSGELCLTSCSELYQGKQPENLAKYARYLFLMHGKGLSAFRSRFVLKFSCERKPNLLGYASAGQASHATASFRSVITSNACRYNSYTVVSQNEGVPRRFKRPRLCLPNLYPFISRKSALAGRPSNLHVKTIRNDRQCTQHVRANNRHHARSQNCFCDNSCYE